VFGDASPLSWIFSSRYKGCLFCLVGKKEKSHTEKKNYTNYSKRLGQSLYPELCEAGGACLPRPDVATKVDESGNG
jgi:hypothetical protein